MPGCSSSPRRSPAAKTGLYDRRGAFRESVQALHSYELLLPYVGLVACALMLAVTVTGLLLVVRDRH